MTIQIRQFDPTEITKIPERFDQLGDKVEKFIDFGTVKKVDLINYSFSGTDSDLIGIIIRPEDLPKNIENIKLYLLNSSGFESTQIRFSSSTNPVTSLEFEKMIDIPENASTSPIILTFGGSNQITSLNQSTRFIYLKSRTGFKEDFGQIGGDNVDNFKFAVQYYEIGDPIPKLQTIPGKLEVRPNSLDVILKRLPKVYSHSESSNNYKFVKLISLENDQIKFNSFEVQKEHWIDSAHYVQN